MPTYEYKCKSCGHEFEVTQKITASPLQNCPKCKKGKLERLLNPSAFILKGKGWYVTDYARKDGGGGSRGNAKEDKGNLSAAAGTEKKEAGESPKAKDVKGTKETPKDSAQESLKTASNS